MVISQQLKHQGMIDDTFPTVTFSKEHKKIVTLTNKEVMCNLEILIFYFKQDIFTFCR